MTSVKIPGKGYVQGCTSLPNGRIYVMRWSCVLEIDENLRSSIYAGDPTVFQSKLGHRLTEARFFNLHTIHAMADRLILYDYGSCKVLQIVGDEVVSIAGSGARGVADGPVAEATFDYIWGISTTRNGQILLVDRDNHCIRIISPDGMVSTLGRNVVGADVDGGAHNCSFSSPFGICVTPDESIYVSCMSATLRRISPDLQHVSTVLSSTGSRGRTEGICASSDGSVLLCEYENGKIRIFNPFTQELSKSELMATSPRGVAIPTKSAVFVSKNVDDDSTSYFSELPFDFQNVAPYFPKVLNMKLFGGRDLDFVGFETLLGSTPTFAPSDVLFMPYGLPPLNYHSHVLSLIPLKIPVQEAFNGLFDTWKQETLTMVERLPSLLLYHLYSCGEQLDTSGIPEQDLPTLYALLILLLVRMGLTSTFLHQELYNSISKQTTAHLTQLLTLLTSLPHIDTPTVEAICRRLALPNSQFDQHEHHLDPLLFSNAALHQVITSRIKTGLPPLPTSLNSIGASQTQHTDSEPLPSSSVPLLPDIRQALQSALSTLSDQLRWELLLLKSNMPTCTARLEDEHLWLIGIQDYPKAVPVLDWVLYSRWPYFRRMIQSGLVESDTRLLQLPPDFPVSFLLPFLRYLYNSDLDTTRIDHDDLDLINANAGEYELQNLQGDSLPGFRALFDSIAASSKKRKEGVEQKLKSSKD